MLEVKPTSYLRKSTEQDDRQAASLDDQQVEMVNLAISKRIALAEHLRESHSAGVPGTRPIFEDLKDRIESGGINTIFVWRLDRLARNMEEGGWITHRILTGKVQVITPEATYDKDTDPIVPSVWMAQATGERLKLIANIKRGIRGKIAKGLYNWRAPIGMINIGRTKGLRTITPDPAKYLLVKALFEEALKGIGLRRLVLFADQIGLHGQQTKGQEKPLTINGVSSILSNPVYYGYMRYLGDIYKGSWEPVVSKELWDRVQEVIHNKSAARPKNKNHPYAGVLMICGYCGSAISAEEKHKNGRIYFIHRCGRRKGFRTKPTDCKQLGIRREALEEQFLSNIRKITIPNDLYEKGVEYLKSKNREAMESQTSITLSLQDEEKRIESRIEKLVDLYADGDLDKDTYDRKRREYALSLASVTDRRAARDQNSVNWLEQAGELLKLARDAEKIFMEATPKEREQLVRVIGSHLKLMDKKVIWEYKKPFSYIAENRGRKDWWSWGESHPRPEDDQEWLLHT